MMIQGKNHGNIFKMLRTSLFLSINLGLVFAIWISVYVSLLCKGLSLKSNEALETHVLLL